MTDMSSISLEQRVRNIEDELRRANERIAALVEQRQRAAGARFLAVGGITVLLLVVGLVVPTPGAAPATFTAPFTVTSPNSKARVEVMDNQNKSGLLMKFYNSSGGEVAGIGVSDASRAGAIGVKSPNGSQMVLIGLDPASGAPYVELDSEGKKLAELAKGSENNMGLRIWSSQGEAVDLELKSGNGYLKLANSLAVSRVEAGTQQNGDGSVKVFGPTGKCLPPSTGIPCMMVAK